jgi:sugar phosphate isomerase/epimerase
LTNQIGVVTSFIKLSSFPLEDIFAAVANSGFKYLELSAPLVFKTLANFQRPAPDAEEIDEARILLTLDLCKRHGLQVYCISGHDYLMKTNGVHNVKKALDLTGRFGARYLTSDTGIVRNEAEKKSFLADLRELSEYARKLNVRIALETMGDWCNSGKSGAEVVGEISLPNVGLNYDTGNVIYQANARPEEDIKHALHEIFFLHLKDQIGGYNVFNFPAIGSGEVDFPTIFSILERSGYTGPISVELKLDGKEHSIGEIEQGLKASCRFLQQCGFEI